MRVANLVNDAEYNIQQSNQALATALQQVSTGLSVNQPSDNPAASAKLVTSLAASANVDQYTSNVSAVNSQLQTADSALSAVVTGLTSAVSLGTEGANGTTPGADRQTIATQVEGILSNVVAQANTSNQGSYVFAGSANTTAPVVQAATTFLTQEASVEPPLTATLPLTAGSVTTVTDAATGKTFIFTVSAGETISDLSAAIAAAASDGTLAAGTAASISNGQLQITAGANSGGIVVTSNDPVLGPFAASPGTEVANAYAYVGNSAVNTAQVGDHLTVPTNVPGNQLFTGGANVIGALNGLITALKSGTTSQIGSATQAVSTALNAVSQKRVPLDNTISQLNAQESYLSQEKVTLSSQQTSLVGADLATSAVNLSQAETQNSAVLAASAKVIPQSLLNYISPVA
jgi:flagellin-like hook-associated protein FlgL